MTQFEIIMRTDTTELPAEIGNFAEVKAAISEALQHYRTDVVVDADSVKEAEKTRAHLRKTKEKIETYRKDAKSAYLAKFEKLELQCKELSGLIEQPITAIDGKIKAFEASEAAEKWAELNCFFGSVKPPEWLTLDDVANPKWRNKGMTLDKLKQEISKAICTLQDEYTELQNLYEKSPLWTAISQRFMQTKDKSQTLIYAAQLERQHSEEQKRAEAVREDREEQERENKTKNAISDEEDSNAVTTPETAQIASDVAETCSNAMLRGTFTVECEKSKLIALVQFMKDNCIKYAVVK